MSPSEGCRSRRPKWVSFVPTLFNPRHRQAVGEQRMERPVASAGRILRGLKEEADRSKLECGDSAEVSNPKELRRVIDPRLTSGPA